MTLGGPGGKQAADELLKAEADAARLHVENAALRQRSEAQEAQLAGLRAELAAVAGSGAAGLGAAAAKVIAAPQR